VRISLGESRLKSEQKLGFVSGSAVPPTVLPSANVAEQRKSPAKHHVCESYCILLHFVPVGIYKENEIFTAFNTHRP